MYQDSERKQKKVDTEDLSSKGLPDFTEDLVVGSIGTGSHRLLSPFFMEEIRFSRENFVRKNRILSDRLPQKIDPHDGKTSFGHKTVILSLRRGYCGAG